MERYGYKVVTPDMKSLGLRRNPNIMTFEPGEWIVLPPENLEPGRGDWSGIWVAREKGGARTLQEYMKDKYGKACRIFLARLGNVLYENSYRIKTDAVFLEEEV